MIRYTTVKRTWRERLTSLTPWQATKDIPAFAPDVTKPRYVPASRFTQSLPMSQAGLARQQREAPTRPADHYQPSSAYFGNVGGQYLGVGREHLVSNPPMDQNSTYQGPPPESSCPAPSSSPSYDSCSSSDSSSSFSTDTGGSTSSSFD